MFSIRQIAMPTIGESSAELQRIGFSRSQADAMAADTMWLHFKVEALPDALSSPLQAAAHAAAIRITMPPVPRAATRGLNLILSGSPSRMKTFMECLEKGELPELTSISMELRHLLDNLEKARFTIPCRTKTLVMGERTLIMGTINVTPDSFSDGNAFFDHGRAVARAMEMVEEGVDIIDIGGESTRPGAKSVGPEEELARIIQVIGKISNQTDIPISVDTRRARVAHEALENGGQIINDVSALRFDPEMARVVSSWGVPVVLMHMRGSPETMQKDIHYTSLLSEILQYLGESIELARRSGVNVERIIVDPGIGFGKTVGHNLAILKNLRQLGGLGRPILVGTSRKSFIGHILNLDVTQREEGTMASVAASILNGAHVVRVHNVKNAARVARIVDAIKGVSIPEA